MALEIVSRHENIEDHIYGYFFYMPQLTPSGCPGVLRELLSHPIQSTPNHYAKVAKRRLEQPQRFEDIMLNLEVTSKGGSERRSWVFRPALMAN